MRSSRKKRLSLLEGLFFVLLSMIWESFWMCYMSICKKKTGYFQFFLLKIYQMFQSVTTGIASSTDMQSIHCI